jgi:glycerol-3-phosphate acyltransferase PlsY
MILTLIIGGLIAYLLGSIPTAVWLGKVKYGIDVREHGSKNAGATNTFRVLGKKPGIVVLSVDVFKGIAAVVLPSLLFGKGLTDDELINVRVLSAICAVLGHVLPIFAGFKGGKGVATSLGVIIGLHPETAGICLGLFLIVFMISGFVSLGAITAAVTFPIVLILMFNVNSPVFISFSILLSAAVIIAHRKNIKRLLSGTEHKMNLFKK